MGLAARLSSRFNAYYEARPGLSIDRPSRDTPD